MFLPLIFKADGLKCLIVGGGEVACRKVQPLKEVGCGIKVIAPQISGVIQQLVAAEGIEWLAREFRAGDCSGSQLVIAATEQREVNRRIFNEAKSLGIPVNVVDDPELCTVIFPAVWRQGPLTVAVSTEGVAPFMASEICGRLAEAAAPMASWVEIAGRFRAVVRGAITDWGEKNRLYGLFLDSVLPGEAAEPPASKSLHD